MIHYSQRNRSLAFGDFAHDSFSCPAITTCPVVCVANIDECPTACAQQFDDDDDANVEYEICADGSCINPNNGESCQHVSNSNPCQCENLPLACPKQINDYSSCQSNYGNYYADNQSCLEYQKETLPLVDFSSVAFAGGYIYMGLITGCMLLWCRWNQRWKSVEGSVAGLECATGAVEGNRAKATLGAKGRSMSSDAMEGGSKTTPSDGSLDGNNDELSTPYYNAATNLRKNECWTQTGYKSTKVGMCLYSLIVITHIAIQLLLLFLTIEYYKQQGAISNMGNPIFYDDVQVLMAFEIVWTIGFLWCFFLKYPYSIRSLFLRRCLHGEATYIAVSAPIQVMDTHYQNKWITRLLLRMGHASRSVLSFLYSDETQNPSTGTQHEVTFCEVFTDPKTGSKHFYFRMRRYIYNNELKKYIPGCWNAKNANIGTWLDESYMYCGLTSEEANMRLAIVGPNVLDLKKPTLFGCIKNEFSKPFYLYQNFMVWTWGPFWYYYMAIVNTVVRVTGGMVVAIFQYGSDMDLYRLMVTEGTVEVIRDGGTVIKMDQMDVVPGDVVKLSPGIAYFDMCVLQSKHILIDESALTGEVHPISKIPLDPAQSTSQYNKRTHKTSIISAGTTVLECGGGDGISDGDLAVVTETGSFTAKGELLCDVLSYQRHKFKFDTEVSIILAILVVEAVVMLALVFRAIEDNWVYSWFYGMFVVGTVLPPLLPTVFVVSVGISCKRLQSKRITCTDSRSILVAGKVRQACFDKTGTLTKQGLDFVSALRGEELMNLAGSGLEASYQSSGPVDEVLMRGLAVCHTLNVSAEGTLIGAAVDRMGFASVSKARLLDGKTVRYGSDTIKYIKRFEFNHHTMTQSVIIRHANETVVYVKGSPESVGRLCRPESLPSNFEAKARQSARDGIYQLAIATSTFASTKPIGEVTRRDIERDLTFAGFINFQNQLKEDTPQVIHELHEGNVSCTMITGDNVLTGVYIAKKARLIDPQNAVIIANSIQHNGEIEWVNASDDSALSFPNVSELESFSQTTTLAMTGEVWQYLLDHEPSKAVEFAKYTSVFGRCTPNDKVSIVTTFVELGEICLMCGDGGNDCGALKAAHVGIALSDAEASVVAPFTSLDKSITSVTEVLKEGRCALASALAAYKYMIMYGQIESINQIVNAYLHITFSEWCWVFMDGLWTISMAFCLPLANAAKRLSETRPTASLLGPHTLSSTCGVLAINVLFLALGLAALWNQPWFQCRKWNSHDVGNTLTIGDNYETSVIFVISGYQYISSAAAYNFGYTHRASWFNNHIFVFFFTLWTIMHFTATLTQTKFSCIWRLNCDNDHVVRWVTSAEPEPIYNNFNTTVMPISFRVLLVVLMVANLTANCFWDYFVVNRWIPNFFIRAGTTDDSQHGNEDGFKAASERVLS